ncbi:hypothetical protein TNCV_778481 [Trichonephila clavipes]|nr:hypothetical protein TNCV_778481 [Trichonephila clavipes]
MASYCTMTMPDHILYVLDVSQQNNEEILPRPSYSPDLTPCNFWLLLNLKSHYKANVLQAIKDHLYVPLVSLIRKCTIESIDIKKGQKKLRFKNLAAVGFQPMPKIKIVPETSALDHLTTLPPSHRID